MSDVQIHKQLKCRIRIVVLGLVSYFFSDFPDSANFVNFADVGDFADFDDSADYSESADNTLMIR